MGPRVGAGRLRPLRRRPARRQLRRRPDQRVRGEGERALRAPRHAQGRRRQEARDRRAVGARVRQRRQQRHAERPLLHRRPERRGRTGSSGRSTRAESSSTAASCGPSGSHEAASSGRRRQQPAIPAAQSGTGPRTTPPLPTVTIRPARRSRAMSLAKLKMRALAVTSEAYLQSIRLRSRARTSCIARKHLAVGLACSCPSQHPPDRLNSCRRRACRSASRSGTFSFLSSAATWLRTVARETKRRRRDLRRREALAQQAEDLPLAARQVVAALGDDRAAPRAVVAELGDDARDEPARDRRAAVRARRGAHPAGGRGRCPSAGSRRRRRAARSAGRRRRARR